MYIYTCTNSITVKICARKYIECIYRLNSQCVFVHCIIKRPIQTIYEFRVEGELNQRRHMHVFTLNPMHAYLCM